MKKIYLTGYYGQNNLGDDYIFYSILDQLGDLKQEVELNVEIGNSNFDESVYNELVSKYRNVTIKYTYIDGLRGKINKVFSLVKANNWIVGGWTISYRRCCWLEAPYCIFEVGKYFRN